jgi:hypothetical protein
MNNIMTLSIMTLRLTALGLMTLGITTLSTMALILTKPSIVPFSKMTFGI